MKTTWSQSHSASLFGKARLVLSTLALSSLLDLPRLQYRLRAAHALRSSHEPRVGLLCEMVRRTLHAHPDTSSALIHRPFPTRRTRGEIAPRRVRLSFKFGSCLHGHCCHKHGHCNAPSPRDCPPPPTSNDPGEARMCINLRSPLTTPCKSCFV